MKKSEMVNMLIKHYTHGNKTQFAQLLGVTPQTIGSWLTRDTFNAELIFEKFPEVSASWLLTGVGKMLNTSTPKDVSNMHNICNTIIPPNDSTTSVDGKPVEVQELPIIPAKIVNAPSIDVYKYISDNENDLETAPVVQQFPDSKAFYRIKTKAMEPSICAGDMLALAAYPVGCERIVPGDPYSVDTNTNGLVTRLLYNHPDGFLARSYNPEKYPDFVIAREEIIRVFRIVGLLRINVQ